MTQEDVLLLKGAPGSPYTRKMLAYLRFRHLPYRFLIGNQAESLGMPRPKVSLLPTFYLPKEDGELEAVVDSTPLIRRFESQFKGRSALPPRPVLSFLNYLIEDYADEWLTKPLFHYRWTYRADIDKAGTILPHWSNLKSSEAELKPLQKFVAERQISRLYVVGSNEITAPVIEDSYKRFLGIFDRLIQRHEFLFGNRPSSADFGIYGQLTQLSGFDPTPMKICLETAPRIYAWTSMCDDLSGNQSQDTDWISVESAQVSLRELLVEIGRVYVPAMLANAAAVRSGSEQVKTTIDGKEWQQPAFPYQAKCLQWVIEEYQRLSREDQETATRILEETGCERLFQGVNK